MFHSFLAVTMCLKYADVEYVTRVTKETIKLDKTVQSNPEAFQTPEDVQILLEVCHKVVHIFANFLNELFSTHYQNYLTF